MHDMKAISDERQKKAGDTKDTVIAQVTESGGKAISFMQGVFIKPEHHGALMAPTFIAVTHGKLCPQMRSTVLVMI